MKLFLVFGVLLAPVILASSIVSTINLDPGKSNAGKSPAAEESTRTPPDTTKAIPGTERKMGRGKVAGGADSVQLAGVQLITPELMTPFSQHIPYYLQPLKMTPGELKQLAGHSIQFIKAKCPSVPAGKLDALNKYVAKLISKTEPKQETSPLISKMIQSLSECSQTQVIEFKTPDGVEVDEDGSVLMSEESPEETVATPAPVRPSSPSKGQGQSAKKSPTAKSTSPTTSTSTSTTPPPSTTTTWNPVSWFGRNVFYPIKSFTLHLFRNGRDSSRKKREIIYDATTQETDRLQDIMIAKLHSSPMSGRDAILHLFDNLCRLFCRTCPHSIQDVRIRDFKAALKALLQFILKDGSGSVLAAEQYLDAAFFRALDNCS